MTPLPASIGLAARAFANAPSYLPEPDRETQLGFRGRTQPAIRFALPPEYLWAPESATHNPTALPSASHVPSPRRHHQVLGHPPPQQRTPRLPLSPAPSPSPASRAPGFSESLPGQTHPDALSALPSPRRRRVPILRSFHRRVDEPVSSPRIFSSPSFSWFSYRSSAPRSKLPSRNGLDFGAVEFTGEIG